jgi:hypothetical protein
MQGWWPTQAWFWLEWGISEMDGAPPPFSSHFSRTAITDLHHNRCNDSSTVDREVRPSPEANASAVSNIFHGSLTTNETVTNSSGEHAPEKARKPQNLPLSHVF